MIDWLLYQISLNWSYYSYFSKFIDRTIQTHEGYNLKEPYILCYMFTCYQSDTYIFSWGWMLDVVGRVLRLNDGYHWSGPSIW